MFLNTFHPSSVLFNIGPFQIYWYGFLISLAVLIGLFIARRLFRQYKLSVELLYDLIFYLIIFSVIGARLWDILYLPEYYLSNPIEILKIWQGGLAIHGVIVAGSLTIYFYSRIKKMNFLLLLDIFAPLIALGQAIGRWGNYFNQELYGIPTNLAWAIPIDLAHRTIGYQTFEFFHPIFFYESLWCLLLFILLMWLHVTSNQFAFKFPGTIIALYLIIYSIQRFLIGFIRIDPMTSWLNLRLDQWLSLLLIILGVIIYFFVTKRSKKSLN